METSSQKTNQESDDKRYLLFVKIVILLLFGTGLLIGLIIGSNRPDKEYINYNDNFISAINSPLFIEYIASASISNSPTIIYAWTTAYNSVLSQTDSTPCVGAGGYICEMTNVVACPRWIPLKTWISIDGEYYKCLDRLNIKYDDRFDIFFDKDLEGAINYGKQYKEIVIYN